MVLKTDGTLWATGHNYNGQLGDGTTTDRTSYVRVLSGVKSVAAGEWHTVALKTDGTVWTTGDNGSGQLGDDTYPEPRTTFAQVLSGVASIAASRAEHSFGGRSLALKTDGTLWGAGTNDLGQLGDGSQFSQLSFAQLLSGVTSISAQPWAQTLVLKADGSLWGAGWSGREELGYDTDSYVTSFVQVPVP
jgi:hypothetical protein